MKSYQPLQEKAYEYIKNKILNGEMEQNVFYSESQIGRELEISRTPIKDALGRLSQDRFIDIIPSKGFRLHTLSVDDIWATYQSRSAIEGFCAVFLSQNRESEHGTETIEKLKNSLDKMKQAIDEGDELTNILNYDLEFHKVLVDFSENQELIAMFESYNHRLYTIAKESLETPGRPDIAYKEHFDIYNAIVSGSKLNNMDAYQKVLHHMEMSRDIALDLMQKN